MRLPSASSAPHKRAHSAAPSARPALDSPLCARDATVQLDCSSSTNSSSETGFVVRSALTQRGAHYGFTKPDPDGRLVRRPETRRSADLTTFATKGQISTYLRLDHVLDIRLYRITALSFMEAPPERGTRFFYTPCVSRISSINTPLGGCRHRKKLCQNLL